MAYFQAIFQKVSENGYLPSTKHLKTYLKLFISCFNCPYKLKVKKFWEKSIALRILWQKFRGGGIYTSCPAIPGIGLKRHTFNIKHYLRKSYLHKKFILAYIRITKLLKKNYFKKFIEDLHFVELSTQAKHLSGWKLHDDWLNDSPRYYCEFSHCWKFGAWYLRGKIRSLTQHFVGGQWQIWPLKFMLVFFFMSHLSSYNKTFETET